LTVAFFTISSEALVFFYFDNFAPQLLNFVVFPIAFTLTLDAIDGKDERLIIASAILASLLVSSYPLGSLIYFLSASFFVLFRVVQTPKEIKKVLSSILVIFLLIFVLNPRSMYDYVISTIAHVGVMGGNIHSFPSIGAFFGLRPVRERINLLPAWFEYPLEFFLISLTAVGVYLSVKNKNYYVVSFLVATAIYEFGTWYFKAPYEFSKAVPFVLLVFLSFMFLCIENFYKGEYSKIWLFVTKKKKAVRFNATVGALAILFLVISYGFAILVTTAPTVGRYVITGVMNDGLLGYYGWLSHNIPNGSRVYFSSVAVQSFWARYFLKNADVYSPDDVYVNCKIPEKFDFIITSEQVSENYGGEQFPFRYKYVLSDTPNGNDFFKQLRSKAWGPDAFFIESKREMQITPEFSKNVYNLTEAD
jgi:hypothetical protein